MCPFANRFIRYVAMVLLTAFGVIFALLPPTEEVNPARDLTLAAAQAGELPAVTLTTLFGRVLVRPTCPVERPGDPQCEPKPLRAEIILQSSDGAQDLARLPSNDEGYFGVGLVGLPAGTYRLHPLPPQPGSFPRPPEDVFVEVTLGNLAFVQIFYDSGIR